MPATVRRVAGGGLVLVGLFLLSNAVREYARLTPLPENADVPSGVALIFLGLLFVLGLALAAGGVALLGSEESWFGDRSRRVFRAAGYLVAGGFVLGFVAVPVTGRVEYGVLLVVATTLLGVLAVLLGIGLGAAGAVFRAVTG